MIKSEVDKDFIIFIENGILMCEYTTTFVDANVASRMVAKKLEIVGNVDYPAFINAEQVKGFDDEAKTILASDDGNKGVSKCAVITNAHLVMVIFNFFQFFSNAKVPIKMFYDAQKAIEWLQK